MQLQVTTVLGSMTLRLEGKVVCVKVEMNPTFEQLYATCKELVTSKSLYKHLIHAGPVLAGMVTAGLMGWGWLKLNVVLLCYLEFGCF